MEVASQHIVNAFEIRENIIKNVNLAIRSEINTYKIHRFSRFLADTAISTINFFSGVKYLQSVSKWIFAATTEVAVLRNKEKQLKQLINKKFAKFKKASIKANAVIGNNSLVAEYLKLINKNLT